MALTRIGSCCRSLVRESSKGVFCGVLQPSWIEGCVGAKRHLLSDDAIKLQNFQEQKLAVAKLITGSKGNFIKLFSQKMQRNEMIMKEELKLLLHLCQSADDMVVARDALYRYHKENHNVTSEEFKYGPLFMRLCYEFDLVDLAAATITDESMSGFFTDCTSYNIIMDMLFTKGSYENALKVLTVMRNQGVHFNKDTLTLAFGTCYRLNTPESYRICSALINEVKIKCYFVTRHSYCFAVALALRQNDVEKARSFYSNIIDTSSRLCQNLKVVILAKSGAVTGAIAILSAAILPRIPSFVKKPEFSQEVVDLLRLLSKDQPHMMEVEQIVSQLKHANQVTQLTIDDMLCRTPRVKRNPIKKSKVNQRTLGPLKSALLLE